MFKHIFTKISIFTVSCWYTLGFFFSKNFPIFALFNVQNALLSANITKEIEWKTQRQKMKREKGIRNLLVFLFHLSNLLFLLMIFVISSSIQMEKSTKKASFSQQLTISNIYSNILSRVFCCSLSPDTILTTSRIFKTKYFMQSWSGRWNARNMKWKTLRGIHTRI